MRIAAPPTSPPARLVENLRMTLRRADERVSQLGVALRGVFHPGPFEADSATAARIAAAVRGAALAQSEASYALFLLDQVRSYAPLPDSVWSAFQGVGQVSRAMAEDRGYLDAVGDLGVIPRNQSDIARARLDAFGAHVALAQAVIALNRTGW